MNESTETLKQRSEHPHRIAVVEALMDGGEWTQRLSYAIRHYDEVLNMGEHIATALRAKDPSEVAANTLKATAYVS